MAPRVQVGLNAVGGQNLTGRAHTLSIRGRLGSSQMDFCMLLTVDVDIKALLRRVSSYIQTRPKIFAGSLVRNVLVLQDSHQPPSCSGTSGISEILYVDVFSSVFVRNNLQGFTGLVALYALAVVGR